MKIGITGAAGYIGSKIMYETLKKGHEVIGIDNFCLNQVDGVLGVNIINTDIQNLEIEIFLKSCDVIFHLAAISGIEDCKEEPNLAYETNILGTYNVANLCYKHNIPLIFVSSMAIFGNPEKFPIKEDSPKKPLNLYGQTKLVGAEMVEALSKNNFPAYIFILGNVYGNHHINGKTITKPTVVNIFTEQAKQNKPIIVYEPGTQSRDFIHINDVARVFLESIERLIKDKKEPKLFNLASGKSYSVIEIANIIKQIKTQLQIKTLSNPREETLIKNFDIDVSKIKKELGFQTKIDVGKAIEEMMKK